MRIPDLTMFFRMRELYIDKYLFAAVPALVILVPNIGGAIAVAVVCIGIWLVVGRHGCARYFDRRLAYACFALGSYALAKSLADVFSGTLSFDRSCRDQYPFFLLLPFIPIGLVLVRKPVFYLAFGARLALIIISIMSLYWLFESNSRMGLGTNAVILSFSILLSSCVARFPLHTGDKYRLFWFYLGLLPSMAAGSRISFIFYALVAFHDLKYAWGADYKSARKVGFYVILFGLITSTSLLLPVVNERLEQTVSEVGVLLNNSPGEAPLRIAIWRAGLDVISHNPIIGAGACDAIVLLHTSLSQMATDLEFKHFHNMFIDALAFHGAIGLGLLIWVFAELWRILKLDGADQHWNTDVGILFIMLIIYGLTGSFLTDDRMTAAVLLVFGGLIKARKYGDFREGWHAPLGATGV